MKKFEFYNKYKTSYPPIVNPIFSRGKGWRVVAIAVVAVLIGPLIIYKNQRSFPFSFESYLRLIEYFVIIAGPFVAFLLWVNWRELIKRKRGYGWVGKFEVIDKRSSFGLHWLYLAPGNENQIKVDRKLFEKISLGDFVQVRRDALGAVEEVLKINNVSGRLARVGARRQGQQSPGSLQS